MSRHTLSDGVKTDSRIKEYSYDLHFKSLGPSAKLVGDYYKRGLPWEEFEVLYLEEIRSMPKILLVKAIIEIVLKVDITLMCIEKEYDFCHRRLLAEECRRHEPKLKIKHR